MKSAPKPEVLYLPAIFRDIRQGKVRAPAFQRGFVWKQSQILELLQSVHRSYPIGSVLFWQVDSSQMQTDTSPEVPFPHPEFSGEVDFILDGMQRISALYGAFHDRTEIAGEEDIFSVSFEFRSKRFTPSLLASQPAMALRNLFSPKKLLSVQADLSKYEDAESLIEESLELQRAFQEYLVPVVRIGMRETSEVVEIFERINSSGTRLSAVDFMRALTWSGDFDLSEKLTELSEVEALAPFDVPVDTLAKCIALQLNVSPVGGEMVLLRDKSAAELTEAVKETKKSLTLAGEFLSGTLGLLSYDYVPYEGQFLVLVNAAASDAGAVPSWFAPWFWTVGFSEAMQGRPDNAVADDAMDAKTHGFTLSERFTLTEGVLRSRTVRKGASIAMSMIAALAVRNPHSLLTGEELVSEEFLTGFDNNCLGAIYSKKDLDAVMNPKPRGNKVLANVCLLGATERKPAPSPAKLRKTILELAATESGLSALATQCITPACVEAIRAHHVQDFLSARAAEMLRHAQDLCGVAREE